MVSRATIVILIAVCLDVAVAAGDEADEACLLQLQKGTKVAQRHKVNGEELAAGDAVSTADAQASMLVERNVARSSFFSTSDTAGGILLALDTNNDGAIDAAEVYAYADAKHLDPAEAVLQFEKIDRNKDSKLDFLELEQVLGAQLDAAQASTVVSDGQNKTALIDEKPVEEKAKASDTANKSIPELTEVKANASERANRTMPELLLNEIEFEVGAQSGPAPLKNKLILILLQFFVFPAMCGCDRCFMGQTCLGVAKGLTFGGMGIWAILDNIVVLFNSLSKKNSIHAIGLVADFSPDTINAAFIVSAIELSLVACGCCCYVSLACMAGASQGLAQHAAKKAEAEAKPA